MLPMTNTERSFIYSCFDITNACYGSEKKCGTWDRRLSASALFLKILRLLGLPSAWYRWYQPQLLSGFQCTAWHWRSSKNRRIGTRRRANNHALPLSWLSFGPNLELLLVKMESCPIRESLPRLEPVRNYMWLSLSPPVSVSFFFVEVRSCWQVTTQFAVVFDPSIVLRILT